MQIKILTISFLILCGCMNSDSTAEKFSECFPEQKYSILSEAILKLDSAVKVQYPGSSAKESYVSLANSFLNNVKTFDLPLKDAELKEIRRDFNVTKIYDEFFLENGADNELNLSSNYFSCLSKAKGNKEVQEYLERRRLTGDLSLTETMSVISQFEQREFTQLMKYILKAELLVLATRDK